MVETNLDEEIVLVSLR